MDDATAMRIKQHLDQVLMGKDPNVGVMLGEELYLEFRKRGWLTLEPFGIAGTTLFEERVPAYAKTHFVFSSWDIPPSDFRIGKNR